MKSTKEKAEEKGKKEQPSTKDSGYSLEEANEIIRQNHEENVSKRATILANTAGKFGGPIAAIAAYYVVSNYHDEIVEKTQSQVYKSHSVVGRFLRSTVDKLFP